MRCFQGSRASAAAGELQRALGSLTPSAIKQRTVFLTDLATANVAQGDVDNACDLAIQAATDLKTRSYATCVQSATHLPCLASPIWSAPRSTSARLRDGRTMKGADYHPPPRSAPVRAVVFDVGEVLVNETTEYHAWADWLKVPRPAFSATFGAVIARGEDYRQVFDVFQPGFDLAIEREKRAAAGWKPEAFTTDDLYPDAHRWSGLLRERGYLVGIARKPDSTVKETILRASRIRCSISSRHPTTGTSRNRRRNSSVASWRNAACPRIKSAIRRRSLGQRPYSRPSTPGAGHDLLCGEDPGGYQHQHEAAVAMSHIRVHDLDEIAAAIERYNAQQGP